MTEGHKVDSSEILSWSDWVQSPLGRYILSWEQGQLDRIVPDIFGFHGLQLGMSALDTLRFSRLPWVAWVGNEECPMAALDLTHAWAPPAEDLADELPPQMGRAYAVQAQALFEALPFETHSIDLLVLPHVLDFALDPHQVLREVERILIPEGRVILTGFNGWSLWGAADLLGKAILHPSLPQGAQAIGLNRTKDWLKLLGFHIDRGRYGCYRWPCRSDRWLSRLDWMEGAGDRWFPVAGAVYWLSAVKRVHNMRLVGPLRSGLRRVGAGALVPSPAVGRAPVGHKESL